MNYTPTEKQSQALINMWKYFNMWEDDIEVYFSNREDFNKYFVNFQERITEKIKKEKKEKNFKKAINLWKINYQEINEMKRQKIKKYYNIPENIKKKALEYFYKYSSSEKKLYDYIYQKTQNQEFSKEILNSLDLSEINNLKKNLESLLRKGKSRREINMKLLIKGYTPENIKLELEKSSDFRLQEDTIKRLIERECRKGFSKYKIWFLLRDQITSNDLEKYYNDDFVYNKLEKEVDRLLTKKSKYEIRSIWYSKWWNIEILNDFL